MTWTSPPTIGASESPRSTVPFQPAPTPCFLPALIVMIVESPWTLLPITRALTGSAFALSQFGLSGSGFAMSAHFGKSRDLHAFTRRSAGFGHGIVAQHALLLISGGSGHLPLHAGQPGGAPNAGHTLLHAGRSLLKFWSSHGTSTSGTAASFGGSGISSFSGSNAGPTSSGLNSTVSLYLPASPRFGA